MNALSCFVILSISRAQANGSNSLSVTLRRTPHRLKETADNDDDDDCDPPTTHIHTRVRMLSSRRWCSWRCLLLVSLVLGHVLLLDFTPQLVDGFIHPFPQNSGPWRNLSLANLQTTTLQLNITAPSELAGSLLVSHSSSGGPMLLANATEDYRIPVRFVLPHSKDDLTGCRTFNHTVNDEGEPIEGSFLLLERGGPGCRFTEKVVRAGPLKPAAVVIYGCTTDVPSCDPSPELLLIAAFEPLPVPVLYIARDDGQFLKQYLLQRRASYAAHTVNGELIQPTGCNTTVFPSASAAQAAGCVLPNVVSNMRGSGPLVDPNELTALQALAQTLTFDPQYVGKIVFLRPFSDLLVNPHLDPCLYRLNGIWCESGHVVAIELSQRGVSGMIDEGVLKAFKYLRFFIFLSDSLSGPLPTDLCDLEHLLAIQLDGNSFTSLPDCIGGDENHVGATKLLVLSASENKITNIPSTIGKNKYLIIISLFTNLITTPIPSGLFDLRYPARLELFGNAGLSFDWDLPSHASLAFGGMQLVSLLLNDCSLSGTIPSSLLDGCTELLAANLAHNRLTGHVPDCKQCNTLRLLNLASNELTGGLPLTWSNDLSNSLKELDLSHNRLNGTDSFAIVLGSLSELLGVDISFNELSNSGDVGETIWSMFGSKIVEFHASNNRFTGAWETGNIGVDSLRTLDLAHNRITSLPDDLWLSYLADIDFSYNDLTGNLPDGTPAFAFDPITGAPAVSSFAIQGNPRLTVWPLPNWLSLKSDVVLSPDGLYTCHALGAFSSSFHITVDPSFTAYHGCVCARSTFGVAPACSELPQLAIVTPYSLPDSPDVGEQFDRIINWNTSINMPNGGNGFNITEGNQTVPFVQHPLAISDSWYDDNRYVSGVSTNWVIDLSSLRIDMVHLTNETSSSVILLGRDDGSAHAGHLESIRSITVRLHISRTNFTGRSTISVLAGDAAQSSNGRYIQLVDSITGSQTERINGLPTHSNYTTTDSYQNAYGSQLASVGSDAVLLEVTVFSPKATIQFTSRDPSGVHFVSTYSYSFNCPDGFESNQDSSGPTCQEPVLGSRSYVIIVAIIVSVLCACAFLWLMFERYRSQKARRALDAQNLVVTNLDSNVNESYEDELRRMLYELGKNEHRALVKELFFECISLCWELASSILNWVVVGQVLSRESSNLTSLSAGYIGVVAISTFAVGANTISRLFLLQQIKQQILSDTQKRRQKMLELEKNGGAELAAAAIAASADEKLAEEETEADVRKKIVTIQRSMNRYGITLLSLFLNSIPFIVLNLVSLYTHDSIDLSAKSNVTLQVSILVACILVGTKIQDLRNYPTQSNKLTQAQLRLFNMKHAKLAPDTDQPPASSESSLSTPTPSSPSHTNPPVRGSIVPLEPLNSSNSPPVSETDDIDVTVAIDGNAEPRHRQSTTTSIARSAIQPMSLME